MNPLDKDRLQQAIRTINEFASTGTEFRIARNRVALALCVIRDGRVVSVIEICTFPNTEATDGKA